jgi:4'-phosphopantetheinyl transferase EntD
MAAGEAIAPTGQAGRAEMDLLRWIFPSDCAVAVSSERGDVNDLFEAEAAYVANAVPERQAEFAAGRACARRALRDHGVPPYAIPAGDHRGPIWPIGILGSIAHCPGLCAAVIAHKPMRWAVGLDVETNEPLKPDLRGVVATPSERVDMARLGWRFAGDACKLLFVIKEALFKLYFPVTRHFLDFHHAVVRLNVAGRRFEATLANSAAPPIDGRRSFIGRYAITDGFILAGLVI